MKPIKTIKPSDSLKTKYVYKVKEENKEKPKIVWYKKPT